MCVLSLPLEPLVLFNVLWSSETLLVMPFLLLQVLRRCQNEIYLSVGCLGSCAAVGNMERGSFTAVICSMCEETEMESLPAYCISFPSQGLVFMCYSSQNRLNNNWTQNCGSLQTDSSLPAFLIILFHIVCNSCLHLALVISKVNSL